MKKIKEKLKQYPKINKALSFVYHFISLLGFLLSILFIIGLCVSCTPNNKEHERIECQPLTYSEVDIEGVKPKGLVNIASSQYFLSSSDILFDKFYHGMLNDIGAYMAYDYAEDYIFNFSSGVQVSHVNVRYAQWDNYNNVLDVDNWTPYALKSWSINKDYKTPSQCLYYLTFHWMNGSTEWHQQFYFRVLHNLKVNGSDVQGYVNIEQYIFSRGSSGEELPTFYQWTLELRQAQQDYYLVRWFGSGTADYQTGFADGVSSGYGQGYNAGYQEGYSSGATGMTSNPFNLITNAFSSIGNILRIELLPHFTLGTLIFTPLVITLIIVIVKMFRG